MRLSPIRAAFVAVAAFSGVTSFSQTANAMDVSAQCRSSEEINSSMAREGQLLVLVANDAKANQARFFFTNPKDKTGYVVYSDKPANTKLTCARVQAQLSDVNLFDSRLPEVDPAAQILGTENDAKAAEDVCKKMNASDCGDHNKMLSQFNASNIRVYLQATTEVEAHDGTKSGPVSITLLAKPDGDNTEGKMLLTLKGGVAAVTNTYSIIGYTQNGHKMLNDRAQVTASLSAPSQN